MSTFAALDPRSVATAHGWRWIAGGWAIFRTNPIVWILLTLVLMLIWLLLLSIPKVGALLFNLLFPVFFAGLMLGCKAVEEGRKLEIGYLFAGFRENAASLVTVGGVYLVGMLIVLAVVVGGSGGLPRMPAKPSPDEIAAFQTALRRMTPSILTGLALYVPLMMLTWFAPLLVVLRRISAVSAMQASFIACLRNIGPFLIYGAIAAILWILATVAVLVGLLIVLPILFGSIYASYIDIFGRGEARAEAS